MEAVIKLGGILTRASGKIGSANRTDKQRVSRQHEPWLGPSLEIGDDEADTLGRMPRRVNDSDTRVAKFELVSVMQGREPERHVRGFMHAVLRPGPACQFGTTRTVIRMDMRVDDVRQAEALGCCERDVGLDVI